MKNDVREIFLKFYEVLDKVSLIDEGNILEISKLKQETELLIEESILYNLLVIKNCEFEIHTAKINSFKNALCSLICNVILDNLFELFINKELKVNYYQNRLLSILIRLNFNDFNEIMIVQENFLGNSNSSINKVKFLQFNNEEFKEIKTKNLKVLKIKEEKKINAINYQNIKNVLNLAINNYHNYIKKNYPKIVEHFAYYNKDIRFYLLDASLNDFCDCKLISYENNNRRNLHVHEKALTVANRFGNIEKVDKLILSSVLFAYFDEISRIKYSFDTSRIHNELLMIFLKLSNRDEIFRLFL